MFATMKTGTKILAGFAISIVIAVTVVGLAAAAAPDHAAGVTSELAMQRLQDGNGRFAAGMSLHPNDTPARRQETSKNGQKPFVTVLTCSDSRVPAEVVFDQGLGDIFVVRVAGNVCDVDEAGSIEYGVEHLGTQLVVVLGHTQCGAVTAVVTSAEVHGNIARLVSKIRPAADKAGTAHPDLHGKELVPAAIEANVWQVIDDLLKSSEIVRDCAKEGKVKVVGAIYDIENGQTRWLGEHPEIARLLAYTGDSSASEPNPSVAIEATERPSAARRSRMHRDNAK